MDYKHDSDRVLAKSEYHLDSLLPDCHAPMMPKSFSLEILDMFIVL